MKRIPIHRGGITSAGYDRTRRWLDVEFDTKRVLRAENVGSEIADRFLHSSAPHEYWKEEIEDVYTVREISAKESDEEKPAAKKSIDDLKRLFGDLYWDSPQGHTLGLVMALAMFLNIVQGAAVGLAVPLILNKMGRDPAMGGSVLLTFTTDSGGFLIFLGLATIFFR